MKTILFSFVTLSLMLFCNGDSITLSQSNWTAMMDGSWMVIFHAPWCPACRSTMPYWEKFGLRSEEMNVNIGQIDVTSSPALTGVFLVSHLPTIIHVKDGLVRSYTGGRQPDELVDFLKQEKWAAIEPIPWYYSPTSLHMRALGHLLQISVFVRDCHTYLTEQTGLPSWLAYVALGLATLTLGVSLGLFCVLVCDFFCPPRPQIKLLLGGKQEPPESAVDSEMDDDSDVIEDEEVAAAGDSGAEVITDGDGDKCETKGGRAKGRKSPEAGVEEKAAQEEEENEEEKKIAEKEDAQADEEQQRGRRVRRRKE